MPRQSGYLLVAAIEMGIEHSNYAFSFKGDPDKIMMNKSWGNDISNRYNTSTCAFVGPGKELVAFRDMEDSSKELAGRGQTEEDCHLFKDFIKDLCSAMIVTKYSTTTATDGTQILLADIICMSFKFMKNHLLHHLQKNLQSEILEDHMRWVITLPALCSHGVKQLMKQAAVEAGLGKKSDDDENLFFVEEPLAAAFYCHLSPGYDFVSSDGLGDSPLCKEKDFLLVHSGDRFFDVTYVCCKDGDVEALTKTRTVTGSFHHLQEKFIDFLKLMFGCNFIQSYFTDCTESSDIWKELLSHQESGKSIKFSITYGFAKKCKDMTNLSVGEAVQQWKHLGVTFQNGYLQFSEYALGSILDSFVSECVTIIKPQLLASSLQSMKCIALTGKLSTMWYFRERLGKMLGEKYRIVNLVDCDLVSIKGAVMYGHHKLQQQAKEDTNILSTSLGHWNFLSRNQMLVAICILVLAIIIAMFFTQ